MLIATILVAFFAGLGLCHAAYTEQDFKRMDDTIKNAEKLIKASEAKIGKLEKDAQTLMKTQEVYKSTIIALARQISQQQFYVEETTRTGGDSGLKAIRGGRSGSKSYFSVGFSGGSVASIHDHTNYKNVVGMGELVVVLNGVEFRTRHNDYKLVMPSKKNSTFGMTEPIPYPAVPAEVLAQPTISLQIKEMREWFKAWQNSDYSKRDYRKYFKPNLCYMEGYWTLTDNGKIDEPFASDRHALAASSFFELLENVKFASASGRKNKGENYAFLPTTVSKVDEFGNVHYAQWNYNILCHPLKEDVPLTRFRLEDDLAARVANGWTLDKHETTRAARFSLYEDPQNTLFFKRKDTFAPSTGSFLENLMKEIPGKDNYPAKITDDAFGDTAYTLESKFTNPNTSFPLNAGYYHRKLKVNSRDAMGQSTMYRGFYDPNLYVAYNTRSKVMPTERQQCKYKKCTTFGVRASYAIPLEIVYTTPLQTWNPYKFNITEGSTPKNNRTGGHTSDTAYDGASTNNYYLTPVEFYDDNVGKNEDPADTAKSSIGVLDWKGKVRSTMASGVSIFTKKIPGLGALRLRYPIMPIHQAGSVIYKEIEALKDMALSPHKYSVLYPSSSNGTIESSFTFEMPPSTKTPPGLHTHTIDVTEDDLAKMKNGEALKYTTTEDNGHSHEIKVTYDNKDKYLKVLECDGSKYCWDGHKTRLDCSDCRFGI